MASLLTGEMQLASWRPSQSEALAGTSDPDAFPADAPVELTATRDHLRQVFFARNVVIGAVFLAGSLGYAAGQEAMSPWLMAILSFAAALNVLTWHRLRQQEPVSYSEFMLQILADVGLIGAALYHSGGDASPYEALNYVPLTIAAATLPGRQVVVVFLAIFGLHEFVCHYLPTLQWHVSADPRGDMIAAALIAYFVYRMAKTSREHDRQLASIREGYLKQRHSNELGTLAALAAHQMSSPLATMAVVVGELKDDLRWSPERAQALETVEKQIELCKNVSSRLLASAGYNRAERGGKVPVDQLLATIADKCHLMQPWMDLLCERQGPLPAPGIVADSALEHAVLVLLASAPGSAARVEMKQTWDAERMQIRLCDCARVPVAEAGLHPGTPLFARKAPSATDRQDLLMAKTAISRFGGSVVETPHDGRACILISLPLSNLTA